MDARARDGMGRSDVEIIAYGGEGEGESRRGFEDAGGRRRGGGGDTCIRDGGVVVEHTRDGAAPLEQLEDLQWDGGAREREREEPIPCIVRRFQGFVLLHAHVLFFRSGWFAGVGDAHACSRFGLFETRGLCW